MFGFLNSKTNALFASTGSAGEFTSSDIVENYRADIKKIKIENQPFRLSGMLHILTNKVSHLLKENKHILYYDIESDLGRYVVGDNDYIEQILEILVKDALSFNVDSKAVVKISKFQNKFLVFEVVNKNRLLKKEELNRYLSSERILQKLSHHINAFIKAKKIAEAMSGSITAKSSRISGTHYTFKIPFYEDESRISHKEKLKTFLKGKKALFIEKDKQDTNIIQYIFRTYGIEVHNIKLDDFERKRPNLEKFDMSIIRSADLSYKHISFFKSIYLDEKNNFKIIIVHELFEDEEQVKLSKSTAHAELYSPIIIGDVEEVLYQIFMLKSNAVKGINNIEIFNPDSFAIKGSSKIKGDDLEWYRGAHIAIVEDSKVDQRVIRNILKIEGVTIFCLKNGAEMLELLESEEIDIIFSDINMPVMDGLLMAKKIREKKKWEHIPIISISSMAFSHEVEEMKLAGMNGAISKPIEAEEVYKALEKFLVMTARIRNRKIGNHREKFLFDKEVLDVEAGLKEAKSSAEYLEHLKETMEMLERTREMFDKMIYDQTYTSLSQYARTTLTLYQSIHAPEMIKMFEELIQFLSQKQRVYLVDYIYLYSNNWKRLKKEVERYIDNVTL